MSLTSQAQPSGNTPWQGKRPQGTQAWVHLVAGASGGVATSILTSPLDVLRTRLQSSLYRQPSRPDVTARIIHHPSRTLSTPLGHVLETFDILRSIRNSEGWRGLFRGLGPSLAGVVPATAIKFYTYGNCKRLGAWYLRCDEDEPIVHAQAAVAAGLATATVTNPIWLVKTRLQLDRSQTHNRTMTRQYKNSLDCVQQVLRREGIRGLYRGLSASYLGTAETVLHLVLYERLKKLFRVPELNLSTRSPVVDELRAWVGTSGAAGCAKFAAVLITYPHEVIRTRLRQAPTQHEKPTYTGLGQCFKLINERIRINFTPISKDLFAKYVYDVRDRLGLDDGTDGPRYLQLLALISFHVFIQQDVDVAIYETHHGGEFDATNVIPHPIVTAITSIGIDHIVDLGPTIENIAWHKAGIFKSGSPALSAPQPLNVAKVLTDRAAEKGVQLKFVEADPALPGNFTSHVQRLNCSLARAACDEFLKRRGAEGHERLSPRVIAEAIRHFQWPGRFQQIQEGPRTWYLDGAHNELSICEAVNWFQQATSKHDISSMCRILIFAQNSDNRDGEAVLRSLTQSVRVPFHRAILTTYCETEVECTTEEVQVLSRYQQIWAQLIPETPISVTRSVKAAIALARDGERDMTGKHILVTGSLYSKHGNAMIPVVRLMVSYLDEIALTDEGLLEHIVDVCISASYFCTLHWKQLMLRTAACISGKWGQQKPLLHHRTFLRTLMVRRLSCTDDEPEAAYPDLPVVDRRSNAYFGEKLLFQMQVAIDVGGQDMMQKLIYYQERLSPFLPCPSTQEFLVFVEAKFLVAKSYKFFGAFDKAANTFVELLEAYSDHPKSSPSKRFMACYAETLCEQESGARLKLALANAHLVKALVLFRRSFNIDNYSLDLANDYYTKYRDSYERYGVKSLSRTTKHNHFVVCTGIAMIQHIRATTCQSMESALSAWELAHSAARNCWPALGYSEMLVLYSKSELAYRLDILDNLTERNGRQRMASEK
ncbi:hypothetical protein CcaCcLH18_11977 [Colletotrichum camelliae]|nr:hypothetical protein CcaCcLH18_11977 [Colletotrichum camelliae]